MKKNTFRRVTTLLLTLCMLVSGIGFAAAEAQQGADLEILYPLMDLVCAAAYNADDGVTMVVPDSEGVLESAFVDAFIRIGQERGASLGITEAMLTDTAAQTALLKTIFAAQIPQTEKVVLTDIGTQYIGFKPVTVNNLGDNGTLQIMGEMYMAPKAYSLLNEDEFAQVMWIDRAIFTFASDATALGGFRLMGFSTGTELSVEEEMQAYSESIVVEYVNTKLGFMVLYPAVFTDELLVEDESGVSASLEDGSVSFFARRVDNANSSNLNDYVTVISDGLPGSTCNISEELNYGTIAYTTEDGYAVFDVYIVTDKYVYQAELRYLKTLMSDYNMYNSYLLNSFGVEELAAG
ncbi:MAG: hypothetical protein E7319_06440 [Clostridiales bacterium]|nr:hypothetical protein [Clostridiales bacterium]